MFVGSSVSLQLLLKRGFFSLQTSNGASQVLQLLGGDLGPGLGQGRVLVMGVGQLCSC